MAETNRQDCKWELFAHDYNLPLLYIYLFIVNNCLVSVSAYICKYLDIIYLSKSSHLEANSELLFLYMEW